MLDLDLRKVRGTPYKIVLSRGQLVGMFDCGKYIARDHLSPEHIKAAELHHAATFKERFENAGKLG